MCNHKELALSGTCVDCDYARIRYNRDARQFGRQVLLYKWLVKAYISGHPHCSAQDIIGRFADECAPTAILLCLSLMVEAWDITGWDPYAPGAPKDPAQLRYRLRYCINPMEAAATGFYSKERR